MTETENRKIHALLGRYCEQLVGGEDACLQPVKLLVAALVSAQETWRNKVGG